MKKFLTAALLAGGLIVTTATAASAHTSIVSHDEVCTDEGVTTTVVTFDNDYNLVATVTYQWDSESADTVTIAPGTAQNHTTASLPSHAVGTIKYHVTWTDNYRQPTQGDTSEEIDPLTDCHVVVTSTSTSSTSTSSTSTTVTTQAPTIAPTVTPPAEEKAVVKTEVKGVQLTAPAPVGGVQTGAGGMSQSSNHLLPLGVALGLVGFAGLVTMQLRRRVS